MQKPIQIQDKQRLFDYFTLSTQFFIPTFYSPLFSMPAYLANPFAGLNTCV
ncbi:hypothetical protein [Spirosoma horti]